MHISLTPNILQKVASVTCQFFICITGAVAQQADDTNGTALAYVNQVAGQFEDNMPIQVPAFRGLEPDLSLSYNSSIGNGFVGVGWSLGAASFIQRGSANGGVPFNGGDDRFYLDGRELVADTSLGGTHSTKWQSFSRIRYIVPSDEWEVSRKNGVKLIYSPVFPTAKGTYRWGMSKMTDTNGNHVDFEYEVLGEEEVYLSKISYNQTIIKFHRVARQDPFSYARGLGNGMGWDRYLLHSIVVETSKRLVRAYQLSYQLSADSSRSLLASVQEFGDDATVSSSGGVSGGTSLPPRKFTYSKGEAPGQYTLNPHVSLGTWSEDDVFMNGDHNGDGKTDFIVVRKRNGAVLFETALSNGDGTFNKISQQTGWGWYADDKPPRMITGDANGDGRTDILYAVPNGLNGVDFHVAYSLGDGNYSFSAGYRSIMPYASDQIWMGGDVNADGLTDFISIRRSSVGSMIFGCGINNGDGTFEVTDQDIGWGFNEKEFSYFAGDVNGDGKTDVMFVNPYSDGSSNLHVAMSQGSGRFSAHGVTVPWGTKANARWFVGDHNGDGKSDFMMVAGAPSGLTLHTADSDGTGNYFELTSVQVSWGFSPNQSIQSWMVGDVNGDGRSDFMFAHNAEGAVRFHTAITQKDGNYQFTAQDTGWAYSAANRWFPGDIDGDRKADFMYVYLPHHYPPTPQAQVEGTFYTDSNTVNIFAVRGNGDRIEFQCWQNGNIEWAGIRVPGANFSGYGEYDRTNPADNYKRTLFRTEGYGDHLIFQLGNRDIRINVAGFDVRGRVFWDHSWNHDDLKGKRVWFQGSGDSMFITYSGWTDWGRISFQAPPVPAVRGEGRLHAAFSNSVIPGADLMISVTTELGGSVAARYGRSAGLPNRQMPNGALSSVVEAVTISDGRGCSQTTSFSYEGEYYHRAASRPVGFASATSILDGLGTRTETLFHRADNAEPGSVKQLVVKDASGAVYRSDIFEYSTGTSVPHISLMTRQEIQQYNLGTTALKGVTENAYDSYGNIVKTIEYGNIKLTGDDRTVTTKFALNKKDYIVDRPKSTTITAASSGSGLRLRDSRFYYDGQGLKSSPKRGNLTRTEVWRNTDDAWLATDRTYDDVGNVLTVTGPSGSPTRVVYDPTYNLYPVSVTNSLGMKNSSIWDGAKGRLTSKTDFNGGDSAFDGGTVISTLYDPLGRIKEKKINGLGSTRYEYQNWGDPKNQRVVEISTDGTKDGYIKEEFLDGLGRTYQTKMEGGRVQDTTFTNCSGKPRFESLWRHVSETPRYREYKYDGLGRMVQLIHPDGTSASVVYGATGYGVTVDQYDELGRRIQLTTNTYGWTTKIVEYVDGKFWPTKYNFDPLGNTLGVTDAEGHSSSVTWDSLGNRLSVNDPNSGLTIFEYDDRNNLKRRTDANGKSITYAYDGLDRVVSNSLNKRWFYDESSTVGGKGRLSRITYPGGWRQINAYNEAGEVVSETYSVDSVKKTFAYEKDYLNRTLSITYPGGYKVPYKYDDTARLRSIGGFVNDITYSPGGQIIKTVLSNGVIEKFTYDQDRLFLKTAEFKKDKARLYDADYTFDDKGLVSQIRSTTNQKLNLEFVYDDLDRLTKVSGSQSEVFTYDRVGNITYNSKIGFYQYGDSKHSQAVTAAGSMTYAYDNAGNMTSGDGRKISWTTDNRVKQIVKNGKTYTYGYDAQGDRITRSGGGSQTRYFGSLVEDEGSQSTFNIYAGDRLVARSVNLGSTTFYHQDQLSTVRMMTDASGAVVKRLDYQAFGSIAEASGSAKINHTFNGHVLDSDTDLIYMKARYYDSDLGRFISADPVSGDSESNPQGLNRYAFGLNNPISNYDPDGNFAFTFSLFFAGFKVFSTGFSAFGSGLHERAAAVNSAPSLAHHSSSFPSTPGYSGLTSTIFKTSILSAGFNSSPKPSTALTIMSLTDSGFSKGADRVPQFLPGRNKGIIADMSSGLANAFNEAVRFIEYVDRPRTGIDLPGGFMADVDPFGASGIAADFSLTGGPGSGRLATGRLISLQVYSEYSPSFRAEFKLGVINFGKPSDIDVAMLAAGIATRNPATIGAALVGFSPAEVAVMWNGPSGASYRQSLYPFKGPVIRVTPGW